MEQFTIQHHKHGVALIGPVPISDLSKLIDMYGKAYKYDIMDSAIAEKLGASVVMTSRAKAKAWRDELALTPDNPNWLASGDTGFSSLTIYAVMTGKWSVLRHERDSADIPYDPDDFGRCYRLLKRYPDSRTRLPEVAAAVPMWQPLVDNWDRLTALWEEESPSGKAPKLYDLMNKLRGEQ